MVGHNDVRLGPPLTCELAEALGSQGTLLRTEAFESRDGHLPPRAIRHARHEIIPVSGLGLLRPFSEALDLAAELRRRGGAGRMRDGRVFSECEKRTLRYVLAREATGDLVLAQVV